MGGLGKAGRYFSTAVLRTVSDSLGVEGAQSFRNDAGGHTGAVRARRSFCGKFDGDNGGDFQPGRQPQGCSKLWGGNLEAGGNEAGKRLTGNKGAVWRRRLWTSLSLGMARWPPSGLQVENNCGGPVGGGPWSVVDSLWRAPHAFFARVRACFEGKGGGAQSAAVTTSEKEPKKERHRAMNKECSCPRQTRQTSGAAGGRNGGGGRCGRCFRGGLLGSALGLGWAGLFWGGLFLGDVNGERARCSWGGQQGSKTGEPGVQVADGRPVWECRGECVCSRHSGILRKIAPLGMGHFGFHSSVAVRKTQGKELLGQTGQLGQIEGRLPFRWRDVVSVFAQITDKTPRCVGERVVSFEGGGEYPEDFYSVWVVEAGSSRGTSENEEEEIDVVLSAGGSAGMELLREFFGSELFLPGESSEMHRLLSGGAVERDLGRFVVRTAWSLSGGQWRVRLIFLPVHSNKGAGVQFETRELKKRP